MAAGDETSALHELQSALHKYLSLGSTTPLYSEAESLSTAVSHALAKSAVADPTEKPDHEGGSDGESSAPSNFRDATSAAHAVYGKGSDSGGPKTDSSEQDQEDEEPKKKTKAPF